MAISRRVKAAAAVAGTLTAMAVCLIFLGAMTVNTNTAGRWLALWINSRMSGRVSVGEHHLSLAGRYLEVAGLKLSTSGGEQVLGVDRLRVELSPSALLTRTLKIRTVQLENVTVRLLTEPDGSLNLIKIWQPEQGEEKQTRESPTVPESLFRHLFMPRTVMIEDMRIRNLHLTHDTTGNLIKGHGPAFSLSLPSFDMNVTLDGEDLDPLRVEARTSWGDVRVTGQVRQAFSSPVMNLTVESAVDLAGIKALLNFGHVLSGRADLKAAITGKFEDPRIQAELKCREAVIGPVLMDALTCSLDGSGQAAAVDVRADVPGSGEVKVSGDFELAEVFPAGFFGDGRNFDKLAYNVSVHAAGVDMSRLLNSSHRLKGLAGSDIRIAGRGVSPDRLTADIAGKIEIADFRPERLTAPVPLVIQIEGRCEQGSIKLGRLSAQTAGLNMVGRGRYELAAGKVDGRFKLQATEIGDLAAIAGYEGVSGSLEAAVTVSGKLPEATAEAVVKTSNLVIDPLTLGDIAVQATLSRGSLAIQNLNLRQQNSRCRIEGAIRLVDDRTNKLTADPSLNLKILPSEIRLEDFAVDSGVKGSVSFSGRLGGTVRKPAGELSARAVGLDIIVMPVDQLDLTAVLTDDVVRVGWLEARFPDGQTLRGSGALSLGKRTYQFDAVSEGVSLHLVRALRGGDIADGLAMFKLSGRGDWWEVPFFSGDMHIGKVKILNQSLDHMEADIRFDDRLMDVTVHGDAVLSGTLNLADMAFSARCNAGQAALAPWFAMAGRPDMGGALTGIAEAEGVLTDILTMTASAQIDQAVLSYRQRDWVKAGPFRLDYRDGVMNISKVRLAVAEDGAVTISGRLGTDGTVALDIDANAPMAMAEMYVTEIQDMTGRLALDARVSGTLDSPDVTGVMKLADIGMSLPDMSHKLHDINGSIRFQPGEVTVKEIHGRLGTGRFEISGGAFLDGYLPVAMDVRLRAESMPVAVPDMMELNLDADLSFVKNSGQSVVRGEVVLLDGVYYQDTRLVGYTDIIRSPFQKKRMLPPAVESRLPSFLKDLSLDIALKHRQPLTVDNNIALLEIQPDITIRGSVGNPVLLGQARVDSGEVLFQRKTFLVEKGVISFTNPYKTEPHIDITANTTVKQWRITLKAVGTPEQLDVDLTSEPYEEQGDILSLLVFGRPSREMNATAGAAQPPAQMLATFLAATVADDIKTATGLDIVEVSAQKSTAEETAVQGRITLGSRVSERLTLKYAVEPGQDGLTRESASEYQLTENTTVSAFQNNRGVFGGRLVYRLEFR